MITSEITVNITTGKFTHVDETFQSWVGEAFADDSSLEEFFSLESGNNLLEHCQELRHNGGIQYGVVSPLFSLENIRRMVFFLDTHLNVDGDELTLEMLPIPADNQITPSPDFKYPVELFDSITDFILVCGPDYTIIRANEASHSVYGGNEDLVGQKCFAALRGKSSPCEDCPLPLSLRTKKVQPVEYYEESLGEFLETRTYPQTDDQNRFSGFTLINRIVSSRREREVENTQNKKLQALGQMASGIAHDFNNMLTIILGRIQLLKQKFTEPLLLTNLKTIEKAALDSTEIIQRLQDFTRKRDQGDGEVFKPIALNDLVKDVVEYAQTRVDRIKKQRGAHIEIDTKLREIPYIEGNSSAIRNALLNLIFNAIDALDVGGVISIWTAQVNNVVEFGLADTGIGMSKEVMEKIFDPFFSTKGDKGNGLGLSEVYGMVNQHNASIEVESTPGEGTTFTIQFPGIVPSNYV